MKKAPLLPLLPPVVAGILLADLLPPLPAWVLSLGLLLLAALAYWAFQNHSPQLPLFFLLLSLFLFRTQCQTLSYHHSLPLGMQNLEVKLLDSPRASNLGYKTYAVVQQVWMADHWCPTHAKILLRMADSSAATSLVSGDKVRLSARVSLPRRSSPTDDFDYPQFLRHRNVYYVAFCPASVPPASPSVNFLSSNDISSASRSLSSAVTPLSLSPLHSLLMLRRQWCHKLETMALEQESVGLAQALLLGNREHLSPSTETRFRTAGVAHLLSLSGLHVGLFVALMSRVLRPLERCFVPRHRRVVRLLRHPASQRSLSKVLSGQPAFTSLRLRRLLFLLLQLFLLLCYLLLTGNAPATRRATLMCAMLLVARHTHSSSSLCNTLAAAALLMLMANPALLYDVGFQLSFSAMGSIALIYMPLSQHLQDRFPALLPAANTSPLHRAARFILFSALFATVMQFSTLPLTLYHFHSFPTYFLVANMLLSPLLPLLMASALAALCFGALPLLGPPLLSLYSLLARATNLLTEAVSALPLSLVEPVFFPFPAALLGAALLLSWAFLLQRPALSTNINHHFSPHPLSL